MTDFEKSVISLLNVIANGQMVMLASMPRVDGMPDLLSGHRELLETVLLKIESRRASERERIHTGEVVQDQAGDGTGEQTGG
jgi:hypothetical protein